jgi:hypothetical protein
MTTHGTPSKCTVGGFIESDIRHAGPSIPKIWGSES